jgi:hypothetical protein
VVAAVARRPDERNRRGGHRGRGACARTRADAPQAAPAQA